MTTADQLAIVDGWLGSSREKAKVLAEAGLMNEDWLKCKRLLTVVESESRNCALFIFISEHYPPRSQADLKLDAAVSVDSHFRCIIDPGERAPDNVYLKITGTGSRKLLFEMLPSYHTQSFVGEIFRLTELSSTLTSSRGGEEDFSWVEKYLKREKSNVVGTQSHGNSSCTLSRVTSDLEINRRDIAMGKTPIDISARESVVHHQMTMKEEQFTDIKEFTIFAGSWNVNDQAPPVGSSMLDWLASDPEPPDIYAIGFQELDLSKEAFVFNESPKEDIWYEAVNDHLHPRGRYVKIRLIRLVGIMLIVFIKEEHCKNIVKVSAETVGTGIMGKLGNKGGVSVRLDFHNTSICFVNSHLAALTNQTERRNQDFQNIMERTLFTNFEPNKMIKDHEMVYWIGDLNYRINDLELDNAAVKALLKNPEKNLKLLLEKDQLLQQKILRKVFDGFTEGEIFFLPTYKYDLGTDTWDTSEKARTPSWTDRILWKGGNINQIRYSSHMSLRASDHKPVSSLFKAGIKVVDQVKYRKIYEDIMKKLDKLENEFLPQVSVDSTEINFGLVKFGEPVTETLAIANTGQVPVQFEFIKKLNDSTISKPWLTIKPSHAFIMPGEKFEISVEVSVDKMTAAPLNSGLDKMYDILILHLKNGKDIFITVSGTYERSCFGASINALVKLTVPIRELSVGKVIELEKKGEIKWDSPDEDPYYVPKELWYLCDLITTLGLNTEQLFLLPGLDVEITILRDWLDTGLPVSKPQVSIHSAAETLLLFLESLREPVIPYNMYQAFMDSAQNYVLCKQLVSQLPPCHNHVFTYMCAFLKEVIHYSAHNGVDPKILTGLFASIFLRDPPGLNKESGVKARVTQKLLDDKKTRFLYNFLVSDLDE